MEFVEIPAGSFTMGSPLNETGREPSEVSHTVFISQSFYIQRTEVTLQQWRAVMGKRWFFQRKGDEKAPVSSVSWHDCIEYINKLNLIEKKGLYRLPTEAQWEYVCRAKSTSAFFWGDHIDCTKAMFGNNQNKSTECLDYLQNKHLPQNCPAPAKSYPANAWGVYDMHGNVWEWCQDWYGEYSSKPVTDPSGPESGNMKIRRGGSWFKHGISLRCANRAYGHPASRFNTTGFRLVWIKNPSKSDNEFFNSWQRMQDIYKEH